MLSKFTFTCPLAFVAIASALTIQTPGASPVMNETEKVFYTPSAGDPSSFTLQMVSPERGQIFILDDVVPLGAGIPDSEVIVIPCTNDGLTGWIYRGVSVSNVDDILAQSGTFDLIQGPTC